MSEPKLIAAVEITGSDLGKTVRVLEIEEETGVELIVTGVLCQIGHESTRTWLHIGRQKGARSVRLVSLGHKHPVELDPRQWEVSDVAKLRPGR